MLVSILAIVVGLVLIVVSNFFGAVFSRLDTPTMLAEFLLTLSAYFLRGVVPEWDLKDIYGGMILFMGIQLIGLILIIVFPQIALWLPSVMYGN